MPPHLVGTTEISQMLGVSRQRVTQLPTSSGFPEPIARLAAGPIWDREAVEQWAEKTGRKIVDQDD